MGAAGLGQDGCPDIGQTQRHAIAACQNGLEQAEIGALGGNDRVSRAGRSIPPVRDEAGKIKAIADTTRIQIVHIKTG